MLEAQHRLKTPLVDTLVQEPFLFNFFQVVRLFEMGYIENQSTTKTKISSIGDSTLPHHEFIQFKNNVSLSFPTKDIYKFIPAIMDKTTFKYTKPLLKTNVLGLTNFSGPLPQYFTDKILENNRLGNNLLADFLDIFNHRLLSFYYRGWSKQRLFMSYEKQQYRPNADNQPATIIKSLHGNALFLNDNQRRTNNFSVFYAGLLSQQPRSSSGLQRLLSAYLSMPVRIHQCDEEWLAIPDQARTILGGYESYNQLGKSALIGQKIKSVQDTFTIVIGALEYSMFQRFLAPSAFLAKLHEIIKYYINNNLKYKINIILKKDNVPKCRLSSSFKLGWNAWLITKPALTNKEDTYTTFQKKYMGQVALNVNLNGDVFSCI